MSENTPWSERTRNGESAEHLYAARQLYSWPQGEPEPERASTSDLTQYTPNEPEERLGLADGLPTGAPAVPPPSSDDADLSSYYRRGEAARPDLSEPAFAPPPKFDPYGAPHEAWPEQELSTPETQAPMNVYRPREATWAETARRSVFSGDGLGYQVEEDREQPRKRRRRRHLLRRTLALLTAAGLIGGGIYLFREPLGQWMESLAGKRTEDGLPFEALTTPMPLKGYDAAQPIEIAEKARAAISEISGTVDMQTYAVTDKHVLTRNQRGDGTYDFYLFTGDEGRLLCYFEGLGARDMIPLPEGGFYVRQAPYLVGANGSALIRTEEIEKTIGQPLALHPLYNGWAVIEGRETGAANYINLNGQLLSTLWFSRAFPFTGDLTAAYVDTGNLADEEARYLLYVIGTDGAMTKWRSAADMADVVGSACGSAYLSNGELYRLNDIENPLCLTDEVRVYLDCDAMVVRDPASGKYGLFVHGEQHYDFAYDSILPVECDIRWDEKTLPGASGSMTLCAVTDAAYPQPLSHYFVLSKEGQEEYVALSTSSSYPLLLDGEF